eukprot:CAMPEP_0204590984 /NCGR_PEP_ID=MMETSP0661-20131031/50099_1 /ASSEMBLY_ACC=CAM_ASM_000606 /TAXON_ID=109239 /ORGANISM="Alexandrium margalefi, Strain AMGDE01CS-322" /LENGTH=175 /DNA_ID=CAMNT_0051601061 /DNA_START=52 /DNA_END=579 /DNA_ORIENTATION=-
MDAKLMMMGHLEHHDRHTLAACVVCLLLGYLLHRLTHPTVAHYDRIMALLDRDGDGKVSTEELDLLEGWLYKNGGDMLAGSIMRRSAKAMFWSVLFLACTVLDGMVVMYLKGRVGVGKTLYAVMAAVAYPTIVALLRATKERSAVKHMRQMEARLNTKSKDTKSNDTKSKDKKTT